jgi:hypothetical protein
MAQRSFSTLWDGFENNKAAIKARNEFYKELKLKGYNPVRFSLPNQLKKYECFGVPDGRSCTVYYVDWRENK